MFGSKKSKRTCNATWLQKDKSLRPKKLDYFLVSNRWKSCVTNSSTNWAPSFHRFGDAFDHCLLRVTWKWRVKKEKSVVAKDFKAMTKESWQQLNTAIGDNLGNADLLRDQNSDAGTDERLQRMNSCIKNAVDACVPNKKRLSCIKRDTSDATRRLYEVRAQKFSSTAAKGGKWKGDTSTTQEMTSQNPGCKPQRLQRMTDQDGRRDGDRRQERRFGVHLPNCKNCKWATDRSIIARAVRG